jgi:hypothetical protein
MGAPYDLSVKQVLRTTWPERDPYHYRREDLRWAAVSVADWQVRYIGKWGHRRGQRMMQFTLRSRRIPKGSPLVRAQAATLRVRRGLAHRLAPMRTRSGASPCRFRRLRRPRTTKRPCPGAVPDSWRA